MYVLCNYVINWISNDKIETWKEKNSKQGGLFTAVIYDLHEVSWNMYYLSNIMYFLIINYFIVIVIVIVIVIEGDM